MNAKKTITILLISGCLFFAFSAWAASIGIGVIYDIWAYDHNKRIYQENERIYQEIEKIKRFQNSDADYPNGVSLAISPIEQRLMLNYNLYIGR